MGYGKKLARINRIKELLTWSRRGYTIQGLHRQLRSEGFEVSARTVDRDIKEVLPKSGVILCERKATDEWNGYASRRTAYYISGKNETEATEIKRLGEINDFLSSEIERKNETIHKLRTKEGWLKYQLKELQAVLSRYQHEKLKVTP